MLFRAAGYLIGGVLLYALLDWSMLIDRPSFLSFFSFTDHALLTLSAVSIFLAFLIFIIAPFCVAFRGRPSGKSLAVNKLIVLGGAFFISLSCLVFVDNILYNLSRISVLYGGRVLSALYVVLVLAVWVSSYGVLIKKVSQGGVGVLWGGYALLILGWGYFLFSLYSACSDKGYENNETFVQRESEPDLKNIIFFAADGVEASELSIYGSEHDVTPHLSGFTESAFVVDNVVTNSSVTYGSLTAMLTGRYPMTTKVFRPHQMLIGDLSRQHFPYMLRSLGYRSIQEATPYYADAFDQNMMAGFDFVNQRSMGFWYPGEKTCLWQLPVSLFFQRFMLRLWERIKRLLTVTPPVNPFLLFASDDYARATAFTDTDRMNRVEKFIRQQAGSKTPFFAHLHLMGTHCCYKKPLGVGGEEEQKLKLEQALNEEQLQAQLRDAIRESDQHFARLVDLLGELDLLSSTIIVYSSDHTHGWGYEAGVPLIFLFPDGPAGRGRIDGQLIDVVPTLLDYMELPRPSWLEGVSLLREKGEAGRPLFVVPKHPIPNDVSGREAGGMLFASASAAERGFDFGVIAMVLCDRWYQMAFHGEAVTTGNIEDYRGTCPEEQAISLDEAKALLMRHADERGVNPYQ